MSDIIALVNDKLPSCGKALLGFLNPFIYAKEHKGFANITSRSAAGCSVNGFAAKEGWDPVTGLETPIFPVLTKSAKSFGSK
jgi:tripeptidyl-peptidase-1